MYYNIIEKNTVADAYRTAGIKARDDADIIMHKCGCTPLELTVPIDRANMSAPDKLLMHFKMIKYWKNATSALKKGDTLLIQFPAINHSLFLDSVISSLKKRGVKTVAVIHDLELLRLSISESYGKVQKWRLKKEELSALKLFDKIIVHNPSMIEYMHKALGIAKQKMVNLEIFDYIIENAKDKQFKSPPENYQSVIIAGNLDKIKSAYAYDLPEDTQFELYGPNFSGNARDNINYHGSFDPSELPFVLEGGFGLVWDGISSKTCEGVWGEYLRYNNPHKTSLYLASGIPVVIWEKAALADFITTCGCGITVASLYDLPQKLASISPQQYNAMRENARVLSSLLRNGNFLSKAITNC